MSPRAAIVWSDRHRLHEPGWIGVRTSGTAVRRRVEAIRDVPGALHLRARLGCELTTIGAPAEELAGAQEGAMRA